MTARKNDGGGEGLRRHEEPVYGYAVTVPAVFVALLNTVDPLARLMRQLDDKQLDEESKLTGSWPVGFADPEVVDDIGGGHHEPLRLLEFDVLTRPEPMSDTDIAAMRAVVLDALPEALASRGLAGFRMLDRGETTLGPLDALAFEYEWAGPRDAPELIDRALVVWAPTPTAVYQVYYHCPAEVWDAWLSELEAILASFELIEGPDSDAEDTARAAAQAAFEGAQEGAQEGTQENASPAAE
jgi:hypothetical protein